MNIINQEKLGKFELTMNKKGDYNNKEIITLLFPSEKLWDLFFSELELENVKAAHKITADIQKTINSVEIVLR